MVDEIHGGCLEQFFARRVYPDHPESTAPPERVAVLILVHDLPPELRVLTFGGKPDHPFFILLECNNLLRRVEISRRSALVAKLADRDRRLLRAKSLGI